MSPPIPPVFDKSLQVNPEIGTADPIDNLRMTFNFAIATQSRIQSTVVLNQAKVDAAKDKAK